MNPQDKFEDWYCLELLRSQLKLPAACCLSTIGLDGCPNARFVSLKEVTEDGFVITGPVTSRKGQEISAHHKVALTFWWEATERQVRIQGEAIPLDNKLAEQYFKARSKTSQIVSAICSQGEAVDSYEALESLYMDKEKAIGETSIDKPTGWGGFIINPIRMEFMEFKDTRLHKRELFIFEDGIWQHTFIQP